MIGWQWVHDAWYCLDSRTYEYLGTPWVDTYSLEPGNKVDCSGLVLQCLYACGMDMNGQCSGDYTTYNHHWLRRQEHNSMNWYNNSVFKPVSLSQIQRGDVLYCRGHIAIYLGGRRIIDSYPRMGTTVRGMYGLGSPIGAGRVFV